MSAAMNRAYARGAWRAERARRLAMSIPPTREEIDAAFAAEERRVRGPEHWWACPEHREPVLSRLDANGHRPRCVWPCGRIMLRVRP